MLVVFFGNDTAAVRQAAHEYVHRYVPDETPVSTVDADAYQPGMVAEAAEGVSLFGGASIYIIDMPSGDSAFNEEVQNYLDALAASPHQFIVIEGPLLAAAKKAYTKHADAIEEHKRAAGERFNVFALGDALARKDKKALWLLLTDAFRAGLSGEEIAGTLWWQLKTLRLAAVTNSAADAGMKDFPYNKAKRALSTFADGELTALSEGLLACYHDARLGKLDLDLALERWVLTL